jgi:hypothetical protein
MKDYQKSALAKWEETKTLISEELINWWFRRGKQACSYCYHFNANSEDCKKCPLKTEGHVCNEHWDAMDAACALFISTFRKHAKAMLKVIEEDIEGGLG